MRSAQIKRVLSLAALADALGTPFQSAPTPVRRHPVRVVITFTRFDRRRGYAKLDCGHEVLVDWDRRAPRELQPGDKAECKKCGQPPNNWETRP